ncbi:E3 ubiquitin-protein ligase TRIM39-like [Pygocentrus nattereri]|uniref:E3 ubiquitin-protein ligase TRIM39-like n=1 Tax=Pygocentrus nattereri TaxID=42514 RepID=A0A3B4D844_PYGNA|nr:E3 ubiquitin-protein ligase TRIM39-like [Pygocentrus nattereri]
MDSSNSVSWEEEFKCCICLDVLTDPVSTPCGHNFCMACIEQCWTSAEDNCCPLCKEKFSTKPELKVNTTLKAVVHHFQMKKGGSKPTIPCDVCSGQKMKGVKSCLDCRITFCETHLENHNTAPRIIKHKLMDPVENMEAYICQKHERPLELFCRDDQMYVCQFCTETDHETHSTVPIEEESGEKKTQLKKKQEAIQQMIKHRQKKIQDIRSSVQCNKESSKKSKAHTLKVFRNLMHCIERSQAELLEVMEEKQKAAERQAEEFIKELEQEITELKRRDTELEQLSHTEDHLHLLQVYRSFCSPPPTKNWMDVRINTHLRAETLRRALSQLQEALNRELKRLSKIMSKPALHRNAPSSSTITSATEPADPLFRSTVSATAPSPFSPVSYSNLSDGLGKLQKMHAVNVTLDPETAYPKLILSVDGKRVWHGCAWQNVPNNPERFDTSACVLGKEGFSSGRFYYEVQVTGKTIWVLGVVRESINRKGMISIKPENGYWTVHLRNKTEVLALGSPPLIFSLKETPQKLGVFVDYEEGLVSFYDVEARSHIYSFTGQSFTEKLHPFFFPCNKGDFSKPMIISPVIPCF